MFDPYSVLHILLRNVLTSIITLRKRWQNLVVYMPKMLFFNIGIEHVFFMYLHLLDPNGGVDERLCYSIFVDPSGGVDQRLCYSIFVDPNGDVDQRLCYSIFGKYHI